MLLREVPTPAALPASQSGAAGFFVSGCIARLLEARNEGGKVRSLYPRHSTNLDGPDFSCGNPFVKRAFANSERRASIGDSQKNWLHVRLLLVCEKIGSIVCVDHRLLNYLLDRPQKQGEHADDGKRRQGRKAEKDDVVTGHW